MGRLGGLIEKWIHGRKAGWVNWVGKTEDRAREGGTREKWEGEETMTQGPT